MGGGGFDVLVIRVLVDDYNLVREDDFQDSTGHPASALVHLRLAVSRSGVVSVFV